MAPYLLLGFFVAGLLSVYLPISFVERHLGAPGTPQVVKAALFGIPLPLCSCSVIPVAASLRRQGASRGATASFLTSTPQTGVDSILATFAVLGGVFTVVRVIMAFFTGIICGWVMDRFGRSPAGEEKEACCCHGKGALHGWRQVFVQGFIKLPGDIGRALLLGVVISGVLTVWVPAHFFAAWVGQGLLSYLIVMAVGIPLYVCSTGSIPIALSLLHLGFSPGAAMMFLVTGPATNAATFTTLSSFLGRRSAFIYLGVLALSAFGGGMLFDLYAPNHLPDMDEHVHGEGLTPWHYLSAILMLGMILAGSWPKSWRAATAA